MSEEFERLPRQAAFPEQYPFPAEEELAERCVYCFAELAASDVYARFRVCPHCRFHYSIIARERIDLLADSETFEEKFGTLVSLDPLSFAERVPYPERLSQEQQRTGLTSAAVTGICKIGGKRTVLAVLDFSFLGGSMGSAVGEKVALAFELALDKKLPVVSVVTSGGTRLEEGCLSLMQMAKTAEVVKRFHKKGLPFISILASPTTGQVYASFASLADFILAEPGALLGFAPLRVVERNTEKPLPPFSHTAESHLAHGMLDMVVDRLVLKERLALLLDMLSEENKLDVKKTTLASPRTGPRIVESAWQTVQRARSQERPTSMDFIDRVFTDFVEFHGDRLYGDDKAVVCGLAYLRRRPVVVIAQERGRGEEAAFHHNGRTFPEGFRKAQRAMGLAAKFKLPVMTFIDTPGAHPGLESEERGQGSAIASTIAMLSDLRVPVIATIIGEGGSEGALAFVIADRILMMEHAVFEPISPERAAVLLYRDPQKAREVAASLKLTAYDCQKLGVVDVVIPEPETGVHVAPDEAAQRLEEVLVRELLEREETPVRRLLKKRYKKFREMGEHATIKPQVTRRKAAPLRRYVVKGVKGIGRLRRRGRPKAIPREEDAITKEAPRSQAS